MPDPGEAPDPGSQYADGDAPDTRIAALFQHATLVAQLRAAVGRRPHPQADAEETVPWEALIEAAVSEPESVDQSLVAGIAERLGRKTEHAEGDYIADNGAAASSGEAAPDAPPATQFSEFVKRLIVGTGLAKLREMWRLRRAPRE